MNPTLQRFAYPGSLVREYEHWVVMVRPGQVTLGCAVIAARSDVTSLGLLTAEEAAELPRVIGDFERAVRGLAPGVSKFNYLALMMVDPNPHFHAIPRHAGPIEAFGQAFVDTAFPRPPDLRTAHELAPQTLEQLRQALLAHWPKHRA
jgi:diadenosine tetraphosphate (Ap4A) HIT family hydrolase